MLALWPWEVRKDERHDLRVAERTRVRERGYRHVDVVERQTCCMLGGKVLKERGERSGEVEFEVMGQSHFKGFGDVAVENSAGDKGCEDCVKVSRAALQRKEVIEVKTFCDFEMEFCGECEDHGALW